jgi:hypothetical protein
MFLQDMAGPGNRLVRLFVNMARINGISSCQRGGTRDGEGRFIRCSV